MIMKRIFFVAMPDSVHTMRWVNQLHGQGWAIYIFPAYKSGLHKEINNVFFFEARFPWWKRDSGHYKSIWWTVPFFFLDTFLSKIKGDTITRYSSWALALAIAYVKPNLVHSLEMQHSGYLTMSAKRTFNKKKKFPAWLLSTWGSDLFLFGRLKQHQDKIRAVLQECDYFLGECKRDPELALSFGFSGKCLDCLPGGGGIDLVSFGASSLKPSQRKLIILKGYQNWAGRALVGLSALANCADYLRDNGFRIEIFSASPDVEIAAQLFEYENRIEVDIIPQSSRREILDHFGAARIYIGLSISDGLPNTMLEAMAMGTFPIQSNTSCAEEWLVDGETGFIVPPEDSDVIGSAIRRAIMDDNLVDDAAAKNADVLKRQLGFEEIKARTLKMYDHIFRQVE